MGHASDAWLMCFSIVRHSESAARQLLQDGQVSPRLRPAVVTS